MRSPRNIRYENDGVKNTQDSEKQALKTETLIKPNPQNNMDIAWTKRFSENQKPKWLVEVLGEDLSNVFRAEFAHDPRMHAVTDCKSRISFVRPFEPLIQSWDSLQNLTKEDITSDLWKCLANRIEQMKKSPLVATVEYDPDIALAKVKQGLIAILDRTYSFSDVKMHISAINIARDTGIIQFESLWTIFPPGELVYSAPFMAKDQMFVVKECSSKFSYESDPGNFRDRRKVWDLHCWSYDWNGKHFTRVPVLFRFENFTGAKLINTLHCHPCRYHFPGDYTGNKLKELRKVLIERGKLFKNYCVRQTGEQLFQYENDAISHGSGFQRLRNQQKRVLPDNEWIALHRGKTDTQPKLSEQRLINGHVMVDFVSFLQHAPNENVYAPMGDVKFSFKGDECNCGSCVRNVLLRQNQRRDFDGWNGKKEPGDEERYLLCPPRVLGYHLETRTWLELSVPDIKVIEDTKSEKLSRGYNSIKTIRI